MKTTKRLIVIKYNYYKELELKLEKYAREGLILKKSSSAFWTFEKTEPQNLKYTVTYFKEGSIFNPEYTDNQLTYFEYAKESGWEFVCENGQMQIFSSPLENPVPFETDDNEMLENIHKCMKKSFIPTQIILFILWTLNFVIRIPSFINWPTDFLSDKLQLLVFVMFFISSIFSAYSLINYYNWYKKAKKSIELGEEIKSTRSNFNKAYEMGHILLLLGIVIYMYIILFNGTHLGIISIVLLQVPLFITVFWGVVSILKHLKVSAKINKIVTSIVYVMTGLLYCSFVFCMITKFDFNVPSEKEYRVVQWSFGDGSTQDYRLYSDELPLTCQDLYDEIDFLDYSYEKNSQSTFLLSKEEYSQNTPPTKNSPVEIDYIIYRSQYKLVNELILNELLSEDDVFDTHYELIENSNFGTNESYTFYYTDRNEKVYHGEYLLIYEDKIIHLNTDEQLNDYQMNIVKEKIGSR